MKILRGNNYHVDFNKRIKMTEEQKKRFIEFMKSLFDETTVIVKESERIRDNRLGTKTFQPRWEDAERKFLLYGTYDLETLQEKIGRGGMGVSLKRGQILPKFTNWLLMKNGKLDGEITKDLIEKFLEEQTLNKKKKREERKEKKKELELLKCKRCGLLHDPLIYKKNKCNYDAEKHLKTIRYKSIEEKDEAYRSQPYFNGMKEWLNEEYFLQYPPKKENKNIK